MRNAMTNLDLTKSSYRSNINYADNSAWLQLCLMNSITLKYVGSVVFKN